MRTEAELIEAKAVIEATLVGFKGKNTQQQHDQMVGVVRALDWALDFDTDEARKMESSLEALTKVVISKKGSGV